ncbi:MAG: SPFH domain-containing protein, partial [Cyanobacteria bacterium J06641_5]
NTVIVPIVRSKFRDVAAEFESADFYQRDRRTRIEERALMAIAAEMPKAQHQGQTVPMVLIESLFIDTPDFPEALKESIERKQVASITAATAGVRAEIQAKETERVLILAEANQKAIELKGAAAAANAQLADLLFFERLQERVARASAEGGNGLPFRILRVEGDSTVFLNVEAQDAARLQRAQP